MHKSIFRKTYIDCPFQLMCEGELKNVLFDLLLSVLSSFGVSTQCSIMFLRLQRISVWESIRLVIVLHGSRNPVVRISESSAVVF
jgi:hypothetical protein